jgi:Protein of unknown function (DUF2442)/MOSC domain
VSPTGIFGAVPALQIRQVLIVPRSTLDRFRLSPGELRENLVIDDSQMEPLHALASGTVLRIGEVLVRLTVHCEPCGRLKNVVASKAIEHKRGYLGTFLTGGQLRLGDPIASLGVQYGAIPYDLKERLAWFLGGLTEPIEVTKLVSEIGLSLSYCRAIPSLLKGRPELAEKVRFRSSAIGKRRAERRETDKSSRNASPAASTNSQASDTLVRSLEFIAGAFVVYLQDGRSFTVPLASIPALANATSAQRDSWEVAEHGLRIRWLRLDLDLAISDLLGLPE